MNGDARGGGLRELANSRTLSFRTPQRVGKKLNFTKSNGGVGTYLSGGKGMKMLAQTMNRAKAGGSSGHDARMKQAEGELRRWCELCNAPDIVLKGSLTIMAEILRNCPQVRGRCHGLQSRDGASSLHGCPRTAAKFCNARACRARLAPAEACASTSTRAHRHHHCPVVTNASPLRPSPQHIRGKKNTAVHAAVLRWSSYLHNSVITLKQVSALAGLEVKVFNKAYKAVEAALQDLAKADASWRELLVSARSPVKASKGGVAVCHGRLGWQRGRSRAVHAMALT